MQNPELFEALGKVATTLGFSSFDIESPELFQKGEGMLSEQYGVTVKDKNSDKSVNLIVKQAHKSDTARERAPVKNVFQNEIFFYASILPEFNKISPDFQDLVPICYAQSSDDKNEFLIMEDLRDKNFKNPVKSEFLNGDQIKFVLKRYAKFHAFSFALKERNPQFIKESSSNVIPVVKELLNMEAVFHVFKHAISLAMDVSDKESDKEVLEKLSNYNKDNFKDIVNELTENHTNGFMVFLHGDCWTNNLMLKTNEKGDFVDLRILDFQFQRIGSVVCDLSYFLYSGTRKQELDRLDELLKVYHDSLTENILKLKCNPKNIISLDELKKQWTKYAKYGLILSTLAIGPKLQKAEHAKGIDDHEEKKDVSDFFVYDKKECGNIIADICRHMHEINAL